MVHVELAARVKLPMRTLMDRRGTAPGRAAQPWNPTRLGTTRVWEAGRKPASQAPSLMPSNAGIQPPPVGGRLE